MLEEVNNHVNIIIKYHTLFQYFPRINPCQFNNNVNNSHNKEQTTTTTTPTIINNNNNKILRGKRSLSTLFLCHMLSYICLWFSRTYSNQETRHKFQNHFHGGISRNSVAPFIKELPVMISKNITL